MHQPCSGGGFLINTCCGKDEFAAGRFDIALLLAVDTLGDPDLPPKNLRAYHIILFWFDYGRSEEDYGATYQEKIDTFMRFRKNIKTAKEDEINLLYKSTFPPTELWWEKPWWDKKRAKSAGNKEAK